MKKWWEIEPEMTPGLAMAKIDTLVWKLSFNAISDEAFKTSVIEISRQLKACDDAFWANVERDRLEREQAEQHD